jgi:hypothetical protein
MKNLLFCIALLLLAFPTFAQNDQWNATASTGEIDESSRGIYDYAGARLRFLGDNIGTIVARYPVVNTNNLIQEPSWDTLRVTYMDDNAFARLNVKLVAVDECSGEEVTLCETQPDDTYGDTVCAVCEFDPAINFMTNAYYIEAELYRVSEFAHVELVMLSLQ